MTDTDTYPQRLEESNPLREPALREAIQALRLPQGSRGLEFWLRRIPCFFDYKHKEAGAEILKAQHPEFEVWSQGIHARSA